MTIYDLSRAQATQLLAKHTTGQLAGGANREKTVIDLIRHGMFTLSQDGKFIIVTPKGKQWCDEHHISV